jgi:trehalose-phosphatase
VSAATPRRGAVDTGDVAREWFASPVSAVDRKSILLVSDFDGTLSEIVPDPVLSAAVPDSLVALERLVTRLAAVVILSSRTTEDLERLVPIQGVTLLGDSGIGKPSVEEEGRLRKFNAEAPRLLAGIGGVWLEMKPAATAIHYRNAEVGADVLLTLIRPLARKLNLHPGLGRRAIEVRVQSAPKGHAVESLITQIEPHGVVCIGDDESDRPMFQVARSLTSRHLTVGVSSEEATPEFFADCDLVVSSTDEVSRLLATIASWAAKDWQLGSDGSAMVY